MTDPMAVKVAREQLGELISILGELRNAGPRDQRFKQWRQITTTLLQRIWPGDPTRAERFRRIPFSAPTASGDRQATRDSFERGCGDAASYLDELALELGGVAEPRPEATLTHDDEPVPSVGEEDVVELPPAPRLAHDDPPPPPPVGPVSVPEPPEAGKPAMGARLRLKDMLGFTDEAAPDVAPAPPLPVSPPSPMPVRPLPVSPPSPTPARPLPVSPPSPTPARPLPVSPPSPTPARPLPGSPPSATPVSFVRLSPVPMKDNPAPRVRPEPPPLSSVDPVPPMRVEPPPPVSVEGPPGPSPEAAAPGTPRDLAAEFVLESAVLQARARSTREPELLPEPPATTPAARDLMALADRVDELGVPVRERPILRAALIDLARQMESPPVNWEALRGTVAYSMDHPALARRILPLVLPYLDRAA